MTGGKSIKSKIIFQFIERFFNNSCYFCIASRLQGRKKSESGTFYGRAVRQAFSRQEDTVCMEE